MPNRPHRNPIFAADIRELRGAVSVHADRDRVDGAPIFRVSHISGGGDIWFLSKPIVDEGQARAACEVLGEFVNAKVKKLDP